MVKVILFLATCIVYIYFQSKSDRQMLKKHWASYVLEFLEHLLLYCLQVSRYIVLPLLIPGKFGRPP